MSEVKLKSLKIPGLAEIFTIPGVMKGATALLAGDSGLVPAPSIDDKDKFLKGDGTWSTVDTGSLATLYTYVEE